ncbi:hypothetical protein FQA39_LY12850 [Lamprigera yunnana]|nr:hypothetical protein FQA39_LY12850 [Lamprigera yunnana]
MDLLGLRNLTTLKEILNKVNQEKKEIKLSEIPLTDQKTYTSLNLGNTSGIFQLESEGMTNTVKQSKPGPQEMIPKYVINKKNHQIPLIHESLEDILVPTYGIIVYQEQVLQIFSRVANFH